MKQKITIEIDLDKIPDWANYITFDADGVFAHEEKPYMVNISDKAFVSDGYDRMIDECFVIQLVSVERNNNNENNNYNKEHQLRTYKSE